MNDKNDIDVGLKKALHLVLTTAVPTLAMIPGKWSPAQHVDHLVKSTKAVTKLVRMPKLQLKLLFGKANRPSRTYDETAARYEERLSKVEAVAPAQFSAGAADKVDLKDGSEKLGTAIKKLSKAMNKWKEEDLDAYILPHPLMGKVTVREMLFNVIHHTEHHVMGMSA